MCMMWSALRWCPVNMRQQTYTEVGRSKISAWLRAFRMAMAIHCFQSVSCHSPPYMTTLGPLSYHMKPTDAINVTLGRITGGPCPQTGHCCQPGAPRLASSGPTFAHAKVHCRPLHPDVDTVSMVHGD